MAESVSCMVWWGLWFCFLWVSHLLAVFTACSTWLPSWYQGLPHSYRNQTMLNKKLSVTQNSQKKAWWDWLSSHTPFSSHYGQRKGPSACICLGGLFSPDHTDPWKHIGRGVFGKAERESKLKWQYRNPVLCAFSFRAQLNCHLIIHD